MMNNLAYNIQYYSPSNWTVLTNDGTNVTATNDVLGATFSGTLAAFKLMFANAKDTGTFGAAITSVVVPVLNPTPTATLVSSDGTAKIEISTNGGTTYFEPVYDSSSGAAKVVSLLGSVSHVKFTGIANDTWSLR